jgi:membrane glycosyltransferase
LCSLQHNSQHDFSLHVLSDSASTAHIEDERRLVHAALPLPVFYHNRSVNTDFKSGNIRNWIERQGAAYDAFIILDADSELDRATALLLADSLSSDPACGLIQTVPIIRSGCTNWQYMQSVASGSYGRLQGQGHCAWMGDEANYYGHNAIVRTTAFAASAGLPHIKGSGLWNGTILSHDFVEAALLCRAGWAVKLLPCAAGSYEQAPADVISHLKRDARWCLGNFQHSRILGAAGLHPVSRFHLLSGVFTYLSSAVWLATLVLWGALDLTQAGVGGVLTTAAFSLIIINLLLPRVLGVIYASVHSPVHRWSIAKDSLIETLFSSLIAPSLMLQRVMIILRLLINRSVTWAPHEKTGRSLPESCIFHTVEILVGLGLLACVERGFLTFWFLPV